MTPEIIATLIGLIGVILGIIPIYLFMCQKGSAEVEKLKAEGDKIKSEVVFQLVAMYCVKQGGCVSLLSYFLIKPTHVI
jgi:cadmium resistance protein CadD (predicted permease)